MTTDNARASAIKAGMAQFTGTEHWYQHSLVRNVLYTDGVKYLATEAQAYWLLDKIATLQLLPKVKAEPFQVWTLKVWDENSPKKHGATLSCTDGDKGGGPVTLHSEQITTTDFPLDEIVLWVGYEDGNAVVMLPSEY